MKMNISISVIASFIISVLLCVGSPSIGVAATMNDYCQIPPFIGTGGEPNVLFVDDVSGSMGWSSYHYNSEPYDANRGYEGYFDPTKYYELEGDGITYHETTGACSVACGSHRCVRRASSCANAGLYGSGPGAWGCSGTYSYGCCTSVISTGSCTTNSGNYLNYNEMNRIDLLRWAITGGRPVGCNSTNDPNRCDPELWNQPGPPAIATYCNDSLDVNNDGIADGGCILQLHNGNRVRVRWDRVYAGLAYQFMTMPIKPRLGVMDYEGSGVRADKVYVGDFLLATGNINNATFPYRNFIANVNSEDPGGGTPTGPAMWDALNYFAQNTPAYGGFAAQNSSTTRWRNPLYTCDGLGGNNCVLNSCARNFVILMSDGEWNAPSDTIGAAPTCTGASADPVVPGYCMHMGVTNQMGTIGSPADDINTRVNNVYTIGLFMSGRGLNAMRNVAMYGAFESSALTWPSGVTGFPTSDANGSLDVPIPTVPPAHTDWDRNSDGVPDTFFSSDDALGIRQNIMDAVQDILARTTSGTAASVLASGEGSGANLVQATYYPKRRFFNASADWIGGLQNLWYYLDPRLNNNSIREDTATARILDLSTDRIVAMRYDQNSQKATSDLFADATGDGIADGAAVASVEIEELRNIWEAGILLWNRDPATRTIYTPLDAGQALTASANRFSAAGPDNSAVLRPFLGTDDGAASAAENNQLAANVVNYTRGSDIANYTYAAGTRTEIYRPRALQIDLNGDNDIADTTVTVGGVSMNETVANVWKLGDIIDSTPKLASWIGLQDYETRYKDLTYGSYLSSSTYTNRGMAYVGSNDGMLHAFKLGHLAYSWTSKTNAQKAVLGKYCSNDAARACNANSDCSAPGICLSDPDLGKEMWAFIPKNVLPYLKYLKETDYCHITTVDLTPFLFDASTGNVCGGPNYWDCAKTAASWRTILIGGMRLGGACRDTASTCTDCVKTPQTGLGYSSYFALDITDEANPQFMWEYTHPELGFASSGPAIVKINARVASGGNSTADRSKNGRWFAVFGSGPTGPIDPVTQKFLGRSDQNLKIFILDLVTGALATPQPIDTQIPNAFAGSLILSPLDMDLDYQDDGLYIPYVKQSLALGTWTEGGVLRLLTDEDRTGGDVSATGDTALNPANWRISTLIKDIGPITSAVEKSYEDQKDEVRVYFGEGRYFFKRAADTDDQDGLRRLYGVLDPCWQDISQGWFTACLDSSLATDVTRAVGDLSAINLASTTGTLNNNGWYIDLEPSGAYDHDGVLKQYYAERVLTDPLFTDSGVIFFTTFKPYNEECAIGGKSFLWAVFGENGAEAGTTLKGSALLQVSTGSIEQIRLSTAFTDKGQRRSAGLEGVPPMGQGLVVLSQPSPIRRIIHIQER